MENERTFAGWTRTGMSSVAIGLGFQAIFRNSDPVWVAKAAATLFIGIGAVIFVNAYRASRKVLARLDAHEAEPISRRHLAFMCGGLLVGSMALAAIIWVF
jgi:putative membrane protein